MLIKDVEEVQNVNDFKKKALDYWNGVESTVDGKWFLTVTFNPYPVFFGTITESDLWKKNPKSSLVTSQLGLRQ